MAYIQHKTPALIIRAGQLAFQSIRQHGLNAADIDIIPGAAGGPKGIGLCGLDQAIFADFLKREHKRRLLVGASVGSWRFAAIAALGGTLGPARLAKLYTELEYPKGMTNAQVTARCQQMLNDLLQDQAANMLQQSDIRLSVLTIKSRHLFSNDHPVALAMSLLGIMGSNAITRRANNLFMHRVIADQDASPESLPIHTGHDFSTYHVPLNEQNMMSVLLASASIPALMHAVKNIPDAPDGSYRDGGLLDYHLDMTYQSKGIVLYPHFSHEIIPGWFDKTLRWRRDTALNHQRTLLISPSPEYLASLPLTRLPDRKDFKLFRHDDAQRKKLWHQTIRESQRLGDEFLELIEGNKIADRLVTW